MSAVRIYVSEALATCTLLMVVVGSGIMAERLCGGDVGLALLCNSLATGAGLVALILTFGPVSGAQMNPAVALVEAAVGARPWAEVPGRILAQLVGDEDAVLARLLRLLVQPFRRVIIPGEVVLCVGVPEHDLVRCGKLARVRHLGADDGERGEQRTPRAVLVAGVEAACEPARLFDSA